MAELWTEKLINHRVHATYLSVNSECTFSALKSQYIDAPIQVTQLSDGAEYKSISGRITQPASGPELEVRQLGYRSLQDRVGDIRGWSAVIHADRKRFLSNLIRNNRECYKKTCEALLLENLMAKEYSKYIKRANVHMADYAIQNMINHWIHAANHWMNLECIHKALFSQRIWKPWHELPCDILEEVAKRIGSSKDYLNFVAVCKSWSSVAQEIISCYPYRLPIELILPMKRHPLPMLLHTFSKATKSPYLYNIGNHKTSTMPYVGLDLGIIWITTTWKGWLVITDFKLTKDSKLTLFNPLTNSQIALPFCSTFLLNPSKKDSFTYLNRVLVVSPDSTTNPENCLFFAKVGYIGLVHSCRIGDDKWKINYDLCHIDDMTTSKYKRLFYAVRRDGSLLAIKIYPYLKVTYVVKTRIEASKHYIVESLSGELLLISRITGYKKYPWEKKTIGFKVCKLIEAQDKLDAGIWKEMETLHDQTLFVGNNGAFCLNSSLYPEIKRNCVYFAHDIVDTIHYLSDIGVYHMDDRSIIYFREAMDYISVQTPVVWFSPDL